MGIQISIKDIIDIFLVALLLYYAYKLLKRTGAQSIFIGILAFVVIWYLVSYVFKMELLGSILDRVVSVGAFAVIVLFQDEIRRFFSRLGTRQQSGILSLIRKIFSSEIKGQGKVNQDIIQIVLACSNMSKTNTGALIVLKRKNEISLYIQAGETIDATINSRLIENIFFKNSPLHDGAMIVSNRRIESAGCILPVSRNPSIPKSKGLRHRAALGITEQTDAIAIIVSEENGQISWAIDGNLRSKVKPEELENFLATELS